MAKQSFLVGDTVLVSSDVDPRTRAPRCVTHGSVGVVVSVNKQSVYNFLVRLDTGPLAGSLRWFLDRELSIANNAGEEIGGD